ncbi:hypothetical protein [Natrarchaeobaculum sulfurireducens]|uniref:hypothetical protein n=1 Tax=Natrarchaeobaculum sulfurireducens TaxID=2044521 RepID=UPI00105AB049|nr:hypothetical protein [Natrarchaeobaculum sulfurireducens]
MGLFSFLPVIYYHFKYVVDDSSKKRVLTIFLLFPLVPTVLLIWFGYTLSAEIAQVIATVVGVLVGFSISSLMQLTSQVRKPEPDSHQDLVEKTRVHTMYALDFGIALLAATAFSHIILSSDMHVGKLVEIALTGSIFLGFGHFLLTLFLLPARLFTIGEKVDLD